MGKPFIPCYLNIQIMLFDVEADPAETDEVSKDNPDVVNTMLERLVYYESRVSVCADYLNTVRFLTVS